MKHRLAVIASIVVVVVVIESDLFEVAEAIYDVTVVELEAGQ